MTAYSSASIDIETGWLWKPASSSFVSTAANIMAPLNSAAYDAGYADGYIDGLAAEDAVYRMRAFDSGLGRHVYWNSFVIDALGVDYGGPGPLSDVVVHMFLGT